ncbi:MAG: molybdopterin-binding protein [Firmicutes bacterium]|nr:molybdopterin-binding protein [Bacillota bacterium]
MSIRKVRVDDAVGMVVAHDMTKIVPGEYKGPKFRKGHIICSEDIPHLKDMGKEHIYLIDLAKGQIHENEAVRRMAQAVVGENVFLTEVVEGRVNVKAAVDGFLKVDQGAVDAVNGVEHAVLSTLHSNRLVKAGDLVAGVKIVPLVVDEATVQAVEAISAATSQGIVSVKLLAEKSVGVVITGNEVFYGRIDDKYAPVIAAKMNQYGARILGTVFQPDEREKIVAAITEFYQQGADIVIATGGMSVDPDDVTAAAIRSTGAQVVTYGSPVLPGAMFMLAYLGNMAVLGMPACGMYSKITVLDLVLPRILTGEQLTKTDIARLGYGGLCVSCPDCHYPQCPFGK